MRDRGPMIGYHLIAVLMLMTLLLPIHTPVRADMIIEGDQLKLWFFPQPFNPMEDRVHLSVTEVPGGRENNTNYRVPLNARGSEGDSISTRFPVDVNNNWLQFRPNRSLDGSFRFYIKAGNMPTPDLGDPIVSDEGHFPNPEYRIETTVEIDYDHDGTWDYITGFDIEGRWGTESFQPGNIEFPDLDYDREIRGGRLRVEMKRADNVNTTIYMYMGYERASNQCSIQLPFSKMAADEAEDGPDTDYTLLIYLGIGAVALMIIVLFYMKMRKDRERNELEEMERRPGPRSRRRPGQSEGKRR